MLREKTFNSSLCPNTIICHGIDKRFAGKNSGISCLSCLSNPCRPPRCMTVHVAFYIDLAKKVVYDSSCLATLNRMFACRVVILGNRNAKVDSLVEYQGPQGAETIYSPLANLRGSEPVGALACAILSSLFIMSFLSNFVSGNLAMTEFNSEYEHPISAVLEHFESGPWPGLDHMSGRAAAGLGHGQ